MWKPPGPVKQNGYRSIIAVDFDGTIVENKFPDIGAGMPYAFLVLRELKRMGYFLILNTCREDEGVLSRWNKQKEGRRQQYHLDNALMFCEEHGVDFNSVNDNGSTEFRHPSSLNRKVYADVYIDDKNFGGFPGWDKIAEAFGIDINSLMEQQ